MQTAYRLLVASSPELLNKNQADVWDSGEVRSDASVWINYQGPALQPNKRYYWKVSVLGNGTDGRNPLERTLDRHRQTYVMG